AKALRDRLQNVTAAGLRAMPSDELNKMVQSFIYLIQDEAATPDQSMLALAAISLQGKFKMLGSQLRLLSMLPSVKDRIDLGLDEVRGSLKSKFSGFPAATQALDLLKDLDASGLEEKFDFK